MSILSRPKLYPQQRFDLEDWLASQSAARTDSKYFTKGIISANNLVMAGFEVSGQGLSSATISMTGAALIIPQGTSDYSYFVAPNGASNIVIPATSLLANTRSFIELKLVTVDSTPLSRVFLNPSTKTEFNATINTISQIELETEISTSGFSGDVDSIPIAIVEKDASGLIQFIFDRRTLFGRLGTPSDINHDFNWGSRDEARFTFGISGVSGSFSANDNITIGAITGVITSVAPTVLEVSELSGITFNINDTITGPSGSATIDSCVESFAGADKNIKNIEDALKAIMTEIKAIKGTTFWPEIADSNLNTLATNIPRDNQDRNLKMIEGGVISLNDDGDELTLGADAYIQIPGLPKERNTIVAQTISLPNPESVAVVALNRDSGATAVLTVNVGDYDTLLDDNDLVVIARRVSYGVLVGTGTDLVVPNGFITLDGAFKEINDRTGDMNIRQFDSQKIQITPTNIEQLNSNTITRLFGGKQVIFDGNIIDFDAGEIKTFDDSSVLDTFAPEAIPSNEYFWYGISLIADTTNADNSVTFIAQVTPASASNVVAASAPKPETLGTFKLGMVLVFNNAGTLEISDILTTLSADPAGEIPDNSITTPKIVDEAVTEPKLDDESVSGRTLALFAPNKQNYNLTVNQYLTDAQSSVIAVGGISDAYNCNGVWISATNTGGIFVSNDSGLTWTSRVSGTSNSLNYALYSTKYKTYVICGSSGLILISKDTITWQTVTVGTQNLASMIEHPVSGEIVIVPSTIGTGSTLLTSTSASTFSTTAMTGTSTSGYIKIDPTSKVGFCISAGGSASTFMVSLDLIAWVSVAFANSTNLATAFNIVNNRYILYELAGGSDIRFFVMDGSTSLKKSIAPLLLVSGTGTISIRGMASYKDSLYVAASRATSGSSLYKLDGATWTPVTLAPDMVGIQFMFSVDDLLVVSGVDTASANAVWTSSDGGVTWSPKITNAGFTSVGGFIYDYDGVIFTRNNSARLRLSCKVNLEISKSPLNKYMF